MSTILAIDPGNTESAILLYDRETSLPLEWGKEPNDVILKTLARLEAPLLAIEMIASYGMAVGREIFETVLWIGKFSQRWEDATGMPVRLVYRREVKLHLCNSSKAKDPNVRQALMDRYGSSREVAIGKKATPGPLYGMAGDGWSALGVAITAAETQP